MTMPLIVAQRIDGCLSMIAREFKPGAKLTLLVRNDVGPGQDADAVFTNDTLDEAIAGLERRRAAEQAYVG